MCVYETGLLLLFPYIALLLVALSFFLGVGAPSLSLAGFMTIAILDVAHSHCSLLLRRLVCTRNETGLLLLFACVALLLLPLSLFFGVRAPSLSLGGFRF